MFRIFETIKNFFNMIGALISFLINVIKFLINLPVMIYRFFEGALGFLPAQLIAFVFILVAVCVLYKILGRENQS